MFMNVVKVLSLIVVCTFLYGCGNNRLSFQPVDGASAKGDLGDMDTGRDIGGDTGGDTGGDSGDNTGGDKTPKEPPTEEPPIEVSECPESLDAKLICICHVPPGNIAKRHNIIIGASALQAHMGEHGYEAMFDHVGTCK